MSSQNTPAEPTKATPTGQVNNTNREQPDKLRFLENDPARTGFDPKTAWWVSLFKIWMGQTTPEGVFHYREWRTRVNDQKDCKRCEDYRDHLFRHSPIVRFMSDKIKDLNGQLDSENVRCRRCVTKITEDGKVARQGGGFSPNHGILICANEVRNRGHLEDTLTHEMVHAWDYLRWKVDFVGEKDLKHAACTEIRASMLSGECRFARESVTRGHWKLTQQFQDCVRARAVASVMHRPMCKDDVQAVKVVNQVWDSCFNDTRPFDEVYR